MALTNQPYLPLYVQDWLSNNKLKFCSIGSHGLMINIMCVLHKENEYGTILLKQKYKQNGSKVKSFASMLAKLLPFELAEIEPCLHELLDEDVLTIENNILLCKRMVKDAALSMTRAIAGSKRVKGSKDFAPAKPQANAESESEDENTNENKDDNTIEILDPYPFENFWELYDKKIGKKLKIESKWNNLSENTRKEIMEYIPFYRQSQSNKKYRKNPETFLNNEGWKDELITEKDGKQSYNDKISEYLNRERNY